MTTPLTHVSCTLLNVHCLSQILTAGKKHTNYQTFLSREKNDQICIIEKITWVLSGTRIEGGARLVTEKIGVEMAVLGEGL